MLNIRVARALGTAQVLAIFALGGLALEERLALVACPAHPLRRRSSCHFLATWPVQHGESISLLIQPVIGGDSPNGGSFALGNLGLGARKLRALLAPVVLTVTADPVRAECRLTPMAIAMNPHANLLLHSGHPYRGRYSPLSRFQGQSIFSEESASFLFLHCVVLFSRHGASGSGDSGNGLAFFDDLGGASRD